MDLKLDSATGDLDMSTGTPVAVDGIEAIAQQLSIRLKFLKGEWFLDTRQGVPYFQEILGRKRKKSLVDAIFQQVILSTPGVESLLNFVQSFDPATRQINIRFQCNTSEGVLTYDDAFIVQVPV